MSSTSGCDEQKKRVQLRGNRYGVEHQPSKVLSTFQVIAEQHQLASSRPAYYMVQGRSQIRAIRLFSYRGVRAILRAFRGGMPCLIRSRCGADGIRVKNNLIAFYLRNEKVIKVFNDEAAHAKHLAGIKAFAQSGLSTFRVAELHHAASEPVPYIIEALIAGTRVLAPNKFTPSQVADLTKFHFRKVTFARRSFCDADKEILRTGLARMTLPGEVTVLVDQVLRDGPELSACGLIHGDLCLDNLLQGRDSRYILDWEKYGTGHIADDVDQTWLESEDETRRRLLEAYEAAQQDRAKELHLGVAIVPFGLQVCMSLLRRIIDLHVRRYNYLLKLYGDPETARQNFARIENHLGNGLKELIRFL
jgi:hypothetical protein